MVRLKEHYNTVVRNKLQEQFSYKNVMQIPRLQKIVINMGVGAAVADKKKLDIAIAEMELIAGQKAIATVARRSIAGFKLRDGMRIGCKVTLRNDRMYEFMDRLVNIAMPRIRDFRGISNNSFDGFGNYALGLKEQLIFPEIDYDRIDQIRGMDVVFVTSAKSNEEAKALLQGFDMPFQKV